MKKYLKENIKSLPFIIITFIMLYSITTFASEYLFNSSEVQYDNSTSGIRSSNVQDAIDELYGHATDYSEIKSIIGNDSLTTNSQTLTGAINELNENKIILLYENSNHSNPFYANTTISFNREGYSFFIVVTTDSSNINNVYGVTFLIPNIDGYSATPITLDGVNNTVMRSVKVVNNGLEFSMDFYPSGPNNMNAYLKPVKIYGIK